MDDAPLLDSDTLSEIIKGRDRAIQDRARQYLALYGRFRFSRLTGYEILRGLKAKQATRQIDVFEQQFLKSEVLGLTDAIIDRAAKVYGILYRRGALISDADILIAATSLVHGVALVTEIVRILVASPICAGERG